MKVAQALGLLILILVIVGCQKQQENEAAAKLTDRDPQCAIVEISPFSYVCLPYHGNRNHHAAVEAFRTAAAEQGFELANTMLAIYELRPGQESDSITWEIGFVVPESLVVMEPLSVKKWNFTRVVQATHHGPMSQLDQIYPKIFKFVKHHHLTMVGPVVERFPAIPTASDSTELTTEIWVAIKNE